MVDGGSQWGARSLTNDTPTDRCLLMIMAVMTVSLHYGLDYPSGQRKYSTVEANPDTFVGLKLSCKLGITFCSEACCELFGNLYQGTREY